MSILSLIAIFIFCYQILIPLWGYIRYQPQEGDIIFQSLPRSELVKAIEGASNSPYSHCGLVALKDNQWVVIEAIGSVRETPLFSYIRRGRRSFFDVYRLRPEYQSLVPALIAAARQYLGRPYDIRYEMDDEKIYCSELIWKAWLTASKTRLTDPVPLGNLNWQPHEALIRRIEQGGLPLERKIVTPRAGRSQVCWSAFLVFAPSWPTRPAHVTDSKSSPNRQRPSLEVSFCLSA